jgi:excisionase family DNA binding protein
MAPSRDGYLTTPEAAEYLGCHVGTLRYRIRQGQLQPTKELAFGSWRALLFTREELDEHVRERPIAQFTRKDR